MLNALKRLYRLLRKKRLRESHYIILLHLYARPRMRAGELSVACELHATSLSRLFKFLDAKGLVSRECCTTDRRLVYMSITDEGKAFVERITKSSAF
jgi:DNA-binding MarR family transcriptional regulator